MHWFQILCEISKVPFEVAPSHYLNQHWNIVNWNLRNKLQWNLKQNSFKIFIQENALENVVCEDFHDLMRIYYISREQL